MSLLQAVLSVAFGFGILHGICCRAAELALPWLAWAMLAGNLACVLAYDTAYAMVDRDDDVHLGIHLGYYLGRYDVALYACYVVYLLSWTWLLICWPTAGASRPCCWRSQVVGLLVPDSHPQPRRVLSRLWPQPRLG